MTKRIFFLLTVSIILTSTITTELQSQSFSPVNPHDSLLFDGAGLYNFSRDEANCKVRVVSAIGKVIGTYYADSIGDVCGVKDTIQVKRVGQLHKGYYLVPGTEVTTGPYDDVTNETYNIVQLSTGKSNEGISLGSQTYEGRVLIGEDCTFHVKRGSVEVHGEMDISTSRSSVMHTNTQYTLDVVEDGGKLTDVVKVYEGSVKLSLNNASGENRQNSKDRDAALKEETKKLTDEYQSGKLTADEFKQRFEEIQKKLKSVTDMTKTVTINAGYSSSITEGDVPTDPVPFDASANHWWEKQ